jgi:branched-chain amino acid transport system permease protein
MRRPHFHPCGNFKEDRARQLDLFETDFGRACTIAWLAALFFAVPFISSSYLLYVMNITGIAAIAALGLNILVGFTGQISLGHGAFFGVGAYAAAILTTRLGLPFWASVPAAGAVTALVGMVFGIPSGRLKGLYLTIATLAGQFIIEYILVHWDSLTQGSMGIVIPGSSVFGLPIDTDRRFFMVIFSVLVLMTLMASNIRRTGYGRAFVAIRDNDRAAQGMGIPIFGYKLLAFALSSFYAGVAGGLWANYMRSISTEPFTLGLSVEYLAMVIIGGLGSIPGSIFGAVFITGLNETLRFFTDALMNLGGTGGLGLNLASLREFAFGLAIVLFILFEPKGLAELWRIVRSTFRLWPFSY